VICATSEATCVRLFENRDENLFDHIKERVTTKMIAIARNVQGFDLMLDEKLPYFVLILSEFLCCHGPIGNFDAQDWLLSLNSRP
jgi:hypothetical protein